MSVTFDFNCPPYPRGFLIMHKGIPLYVGKRLITPHSVCLWFPPNLAILIVYIFKFLFVTAYRKIRNLFSKKPEQLEGQEI